VELEADLRDALTQLGLVEARRARFLLVLDSVWGDEGTRLVRLADVITKQRHSPTVVVNGGDLTLRDVGNGVHAGRPVVFVPGPGGKQDVEVSRTDVAFEKDRGRQARAGGR
jgi:hypothetical protein